MASSQDGPHRRCLLISNSTNHGEGYLDHCAAEMLEMLDGVDRLAFVPFALHDREGYGRRAAERFAAMGIESVTLTADERGQRAAAEIPAVFVGGGNTFRLLDVLQRSGLLELLRRRVLDGMLYMGASAGSNIAAPRASSGRVSHRSKCRQAHARSDSRVDPAAQPPSGTPDSS